MVKKNSSRVIRKRYGLRLAERIAISATSGLLLAILSIAVYMPSLAVSARQEASTNVVLGAEVERTLSMQIDSERKQSIDMYGGYPDHDYGSMYTDIKIRTNSSSGYKLIASAPEGESPSLVNVDDDRYEIVPQEWGDYDYESWWMMYDSNKGNYFALGDYENGTVIRDEPSFSYSDDGDVNISYEVNAGYGLASGTYRGNVLYTVVGDETAYTASFDYNYGFSSKFCIPDYEGGSCNIKISNDIPIKFGYKFLGWYKEGEEDILYQPNEIVEINGDEKFHGKMDIAFVAFNFYNGKLTQKYYNGLQYKCYLNEDKSCDMKMKGQDEIPGYVVSDDPVVLAGWDDTTVYTDEHLFEPGKQYHFTLDELMSITKGGVVKVLYAAWSINGKIVCDVKEKHYCQRDDPGEYHESNTFNIKSPGAPQFFTIQNMQEMTPEVCQSATTPSQFANSDDSTGEHNGDPNYVPVTKLKDTRDNKTYKIRKLADGNCWMVQNLDLELTDGLKLTREDTDLTTKLYWTVNSDTSNTSLILMGTMGYTRISDEDGVYYNVAARNAENYYYYAMAWHHNFYENSICPKGWTIPLPRRGEFEAEHQSSVSVTDLMEAYEFSDTNRIRPLTAPPIALRPYAQSEQHKIYSQIGYGLGGYLYETGSWGNSKTHIGGEYAFDTTDGINIDEISTTNDAAELPMRCVAR